ncbi:MAG: DUF3810 domain-containing protein [Bacteroides sp.]|nr:DUF3810 domain-containing protein [Eubacterium sp.]MCM1417905.1 DUF3810 domain-containing protein [Roseburia sp.]MCM1461932.1 DUF3810 domain-containing protein [Bacteroides sp.]
MKRSVKIRLTVAAAALALALVGVIPAKLSVDFADWYAFNVYPALVNVFARISGVFPFSLAEVVIVLAVLTVLFALVYFTVKMIRRKEERKRFLLSSVSTAAAALALVAFVFTYSCGINYYRSPFSEYSGLAVGKYTKEQLYETLDHMIERVNVLASAIETDEEGRAILPGDLLDRTTAAMEDLSEEYAALRSYYPHAKPVLASPLMCYTKIVGIFTPYTMEANYNTRETPESIGYTVCHELSHMTGFMREDEANFIAYLACRESGDPYLMYSGCHNAMKNLLNAYYRECTPEEYAEIYARIDPRVQLHIHLNNEFWAQYETPVATVSTAINDTYLKINNQTDGTKSYGRMVDLVIAEYLARKE